MAFKAFRRQGDSMAASKLSQLLQNERWRPYVLGTFASLPILAVMLIAWIYYPLWAFAWMAPWALFAGLDVFWKTPRRKMISWAIFVGTLGSFMIVYAR